MSNSSHYDTKQSTKYDTAESLSTQHVKKIMKFKEQAYISQKLPQPIIW